MWHVFIRSLIMWENQISVLRELSFFFFFLNNYVAFCVCLWNFLIVTLAKWTAKCFFTVTLVIQFSQMLKPVGMFQNFPKSSSSWNLFDLKLTLRFLKWILENLKGFVSLLTKRNTELIRLIWYVNSSYFS